MKFKTTAEIKVSKKIIDQIIGQESAVELIKRIAKQRRHLLLIGDPGTGKSMLGQALAELLPKEDLVDVLVYPNETDENNPLVRTIKKGQGKEIVNQAKLQMMASFKNQNLLLFVFVLLVSLLPYYFWKKGDMSDIIYAASMITGIVFLVGFMVFLNLGRRTTTKKILVPKLIVDNSDRTTAPFIDATGAHSGALLGDVLHDPLQSLLSSNKIIRIVSVGNGQLQLEEDQINIVDKLLEKHKKEIIKSGEYEAVFLHSNEIAVLGEKNNKIEKVDVKSVNRYIKKVELIKLTTESGKELIVTPEHKVAVKDIFNRIIYVSAEKIKLWHRVITFE